MMKKAVTITNNCKAFEKSSKESVIVKNLRKGEYFEWTNLKRNKSGIWYKIILKQDTIGFIETKNTYSWKKGIVTSQNSFLIPENNDYSARIQLNKYSIVKFVTPHIRKSSSYKIQTKKGIIGIVQSSAKIEELDWFIFKIFHLAIFITVFLLSFIFSLIMGLKKVGVFASLLTAAGLSFGITTALMILILLGKYIIKYVRMNI